MVSFLALCALFVVEVSSRADLYPKIEASFTVSSLATDPFDYAQTDVQVQIAQPDGTTNALPAFFDGGTTWRVRHTPALSGLYRVAGVTLNGQPLTVGNLQPVLWTVSGNPTSPGFVRVDPVNANRFITSNGRRHFPLGHNVAWWTNNTYIPGIFSKLGGARENWARVWMTHFYDSLNLEWPKVGNFGTYSLSVAQKWDAIVSAAEQSGVFFQVALQHHGQYASTTGSNVNPNWEQNPYSTANGGFLSDAAQFFTDAQAKALTKRKYRYIIARWGYSPAIMGWELFNEVQFTDAAYANRWTNIIAWHNEMAQFIRSQDSYRHLITTSSELGQPMWAECDYYQHHDYPNDLISSLRDAAGVPAGQPIKPIFSGECGRDSSFYFGFHAPLWAGLMAGQSGAAEQWFSDQLDAENAYKLFRPGRDFVLSAGIADQDTLTKSAPHVTCAQSTSLVFSPGAYWQAATQTVFIVGDVAPDGIADLPRYLQGYYHRTWGSNFTFLVDYPPGGGIFAVQATQIAAAGAGLTITVDGVTANSISFPGTGADQSTNVTLTASVAAGQHTVHLINPGLDWLVIGNITLNPYVPMLGAYQIGTSDFAALWFWHRTNIYNATATAAVIGTFPLSGLQPGTYAACWWDTFAGTALSNFTFTVDGANPVTLATPAILRSAALYAGLPPQGSISAPLLTQTLGTNSPPLTLPLAITNRGGLPLAYSLCVTGAAPVLYAAINSTQPAGPVYAWKDISVVGVDLTTNFTALAAPKNAKDEGIAGPINIGFNFPFFSGGQSPGGFSQLYVSPNGFVTFSPFSGDTSTNRTLPDAQAPTNLIAFFWDDLNLSTGGRVYAATDAIAGMFTLQFQNAPIKGAGSATVSCQLILKTTGEILMQYQSISLSNACTVGVQNAAASQGLQAAYNQNYLQSGMAVRLCPTPWLGLAANAGLASRLNADVVNLTLNPATVPAGLYTATLLVQTADPALPLTVLPISLNILTPPSGLTVSTATWAQVSLSWQDNSGNELFFAIERKTGTNGVYALIAEVSADVTNFTDINVNSRTTYGYRVRAVSSGYSGYSGEAFATTPMSPIEQWRLAHFGTPDNAGVAADTADPDHDGLLNIFDYAFNTDPLVADPSPMSFVLAGDQLLLTYKRARPAPADLRYVPGVADDLVSGNWISSGAGSPTQMVIDNQDGTETVTVIDNAPVASHTAHYLRLQINRISRP